jgi:hypothetical protein
MANIRPKTSQLGYMRDAIPRASVTVHYDGSNLPEISTKFKKWE